ncbi:hypothetical protein E2C01_059318 [Portunus trituberculatus]|uniref:Uncharacterized protein n=1 Tax=Portunus trituberculatus TaxID=210409 RepID=A0A5B7H6G4_PORTR|nr:hypothetical protein [Portunus trituberculatus]
MAIILATAGTSARVGVGRWECCFLNPNSGSMAGREPILTPVQCEGGVWEYGSSRLLAPPTVSYTHYKHHSQVRTYWTQWRQSGEEESLLATPTPSYLLIRSSSLNIWGHKNQGTAGLDVTAILLYPPSPLTRTIHWLTSSLDAQGIASSSSSCCCRCYPDAPTAPLCAHPPALHALAHAPSHEKPNGREGKGGYETRREEVEKDEVKEREVRRKRKRVVYKE